MSKRWQCTVMLGVVLLFVGGAAVHAQEQDYYLDEEIGEDQPRYALGLGFGLVELGDNVIVGQQVVNDDDVEQYYAINFRIRFGDPHANPSGGFRGYLEPELGYWSSDAQLPSRAVSSTSDLLLGLNIIGGMPVGAVEFFVGGGLGIHFVDSDFAALDGEALGANAQFGADVSVSKRTSIFAVGRFDVVDDDRDELEGKAYIGVRFRFGRRS